MLVCCWMQDCGLYVLEVMYDVVQTRTYAVLYCAWCILYLVANSSTVHLRSKIYRSTVRRETTNNETTNIKPAGVPACFLSHVMVLLFPLTFCEKKRRAASILRASPTPLALTLNPLRTNRANTRQDPHDSAPQAVSTMPRRRRRRNYLK